MAKLAKRFCVLLALLAIQGSAQASFHLWNILQVYSNADGTVQFAELKAYAAGEQFVGGHTITVSQGGTTHSFTLPNDLPGNTAMASEMGGYYGGGTDFKSMLIGTQGFAALGM